MSAYVLHPPKPGSPTPQTTTTDPDGLVALSQHIESLLGAGREQVRKLSQQLQMLQQEFSRREGALNSEIAVQRNRADMFKRDLDNATLQIAHERREVARVAEASSQLQAARDHLRGEVTELQSQITKLQDSLAKNTSELDLYKASWARVLKLEQEARAQVAQRSDATARIRALENRNIELLAEAKRRIRGLEHNQRTLQAQLDRARKQLASAETVVREAQVATQKAQAVAREAEASKARIAQLEGAIQNIQVIPLGAEIEKADNIKAHLIEAIDKANGKTPPPLPQQKRAPEVPEPSQNK